MMTGLAQDIPAQIRDLAEKNVEQAREAFMGFLGAAQTAAGATGALPSGTKDAMTKAMSFAEENVKAAFDLAQKLVRAKDAQEVLSLETAFAASQLTAMQKQAKELGALVQEAAAQGPASKDTSAPSR
jgi:phasin